MEYRAVQFVIRVKGRDNKEVNKSRTSVVERPVSEVPRKWNAEGNKFFVKFLWDRSCLINKGGNIKVYDGLLRYFT